MSNNVVIVPQSTPADNGNPLYVPSWEVNRNEIPDWLQAQADRLIKRAAKIPNQRERDRLMRLAAAALETAGWYENGGAK